MPEEIDTSNMSAEEIAELQKQNCIFCKIIAKQIPAKILHEDDDVICVLDINPVSEGHILVIPKEHYMILPHVPDALLGHLFKTVKLMSNTLIKSLQCQATSVFIANGMAAGQKAPHVLIHVFPRRENDGLLGLPKYEMSREQSEKLRNTLHPHLNRTFGKGKDIHIPHDKYADEDIHDKKEKDEIISDNDKELSSDEPMKKMDHDESEKPMHKDSNKKEKKVDLDDIARLFGG